MAGVAVASHSAGAFQGQSGRSAGRGSSGEGLARGGEQEDWGTAELSVQMVRSRMVGWILGPVSPGLEYARGW